MKRKTLLVLVACGLLLALSGCGTAEDRAMVKDFVEDWVRSKEIHPINEEGGIDWQGAWNLGTRIVTGSVGDEETDAVLDAYQVIDTIHQADKLMDEGRDERDASKMDQAIKMRPGDWTYRVTRAGLALEQGDLTQYSAQVDAAAQASQGKDPLWVANQHIGEFEKVENKLATSGFTSADQCRQVYGALFDQYSRRAALTKSPDDQAKANDALARQSACK
jgi:hypothetical protein